MQNVPDFRRTKIVSTIGPVSRSQEALEKLILAGVNVFRLNFSHGTHQDHQEAFNNIKAVSKKLDMTTAILADMQGPKLRVGKFKEEKILLEAGQKFRLDLNPELGDNNRVNLPHPMIFESLKRDDFLLIDDGKVRLQVQNVDKDYADTIVINTGYISNYKGVNFPSGILKLSPLTPKDLIDLDFALSLGVDFIALSFVQLPSDIEQAKEIVNGRAKIIAKIEKPSAVTYIKDIVKIADGIMVARGDLGVELPTEVVPVVQKQIIRECRRQSKPVIVATQMLDSMTNSPVPTRAEASDVANAVYDGADAVMLSGETTVGLYPVETVTVMTNIIKTVEADPSYWHSLRSSQSDITAEYMETHKEMSTGMAISIAVKDIARHTNIKAIVSFSSQGTTVNRISHQKPFPRMLGVTSNEALFNQMNLVWGVTGLLVEDVNSFSEIVDASARWLKENDWVEVGDKILVVAGIPVNVGGITNSLRVVEIE